MLLLRKREEKSNENHICSSCGEQDDVVKMSTKHVKGVSEVYLCSFCLASGIRVLSIKWARQPQEEVKGDKNVL